MVFGVQRSICPEVNTGANTGVNYFNPPQEYGWGSGFSVYWIGDQQINFLGVWFAQ